jgi:hypothetical protein
MGALQKSHFIIMFTNVLIFIMSMRLSSACRGMKITKLMELGSLVKE